MKHFLAFSFCFFYLAAVSQNNDGTWLMGFMGSNPTSDTLYGINFIDFKTTPPSVYRETKSISIWGGGGANDKYGNLQFYTNGFLIHNRLDQPMPNGTGLSPGAIHDNYFSPPQRELLSRFT